MDINQCLFVAEGMILREEDDVSLIDSKKLREFSLTAPLIGLAEDVCRRCPFYGKCNDELDIVHDGIDWTVGVVRA
jgi:hypothetical protein